MQDQELLDKLNSYCNDLIGEVPTKSKKKKKLKNNECAVNKLSPNKAVQIEQPVNESPSKKLNSSIKTTDDGFKVLSEFPPDDSDISDAFDLESDDEDHDLDEDDSPSTKLTLPTKSKSSVAQTEDGFKIINDIPPDDSDVSDAFESDLDESEWLNEAEQKLKKKNKVETSSNVNSNLEKKLDSNKFQSIKKPLMNIIQDFQMEDKLFLNAKTQACLRRSSPPKKNSAVKKSLPINDINIIDHSVKRGKRKKENSEQGTGSKKDEQPTANSKADIESSFKKARHEIFKFGLSGFEKQEQKDARIELAIKLGAKPPKKKGKNYKEVIEERKLMKKNDIAKRTEEREMGLPVKKKSVENKSRKKSDISVNPPLGKFKDGVLSLSKKDIQSITSKR